jgi:tripartite-type tricarboxylate transporter receptor subunit TctC
MARGRDKKINQGDKMRFFSYIRKLFSITSVATLALVAGAAHAADDYPAKPITLVVPFAAGGTTDGAARLLAQHLRERTGATVIVENRPGAGGIIGIGSVAKAPADGYTLLYGSDTLILAPLTRAKTPFSIESFTPLARVRLSSVFLAVSNKLPVNNIAELIELAKSKPGKLNYGSGGIATVNHLAGVQFGMHTGTDITHVPYKGTAPSMLDVISSELDMSWVGVFDIDKFAKAGQAKVLVSSGAKRAMILPSVPTMAESGYPAMVVGNWNGVLAPAGTPAPTVKWLTDNIAAAASSPKFLKDGALLEIEPGAVLKGKDFRTFLVATRDKYKAAIEKANIQLAD